MPDYFAVNLQEDLISLLCFDDENSKIVFNTVDLDLFDDDYREIAERAYTYIERYEKAPGKHIIDLMGDILEGKDKRRAKFFEMKIGDLFDGYEGTDVQYTIDRAHNFIRRQRFKNGLIQASQIIQSGGEGAEDEAAKVMHDAMEIRNKLFDPGVFLSDTKQTFQFFEDLDEVFPTGIKEFDERNVGPIRKGLTIFIALPKRGKTWWLVNLGKMSMLHGKKVLHITLEMSEKRMAKRYYQALFAIAKRKDQNFQRTFFELDKLGKLIGFKREDIIAKLAFDDPKIIKKLTSEVKRWKPGLNRILIKEFPTGQLLVRELTAYLDSLESAYRYKPDLLILDYADLMKVDPRNYRHELGNIYKEIRGIAVARNIALVTASQGHREGQKIKTMSGANVAEDFSKIATADCVITYNQTSHEKAFDLARLHVSEARDDEDKFTVLISQQYGFGQFWLQSLRLHQTKNYWENFNDFMENEEKGDKKDEDDEEEE